jgi:hypothetical protein
MAVMKCPVRGLTVCVVLALAAASFLARAIAGDEDDKVKEAWTAFQEAIKARQGDKIWDLLDLASRASVEKFAKSYKSKYKKADEGGKKDLEKSLELTAKELAALTPQLFLKSKRYYGKYEEVPGSKLDRISVDGDKATVFYIEEDGDKQKLSLLRENAKWKVSAPPP